MNQYLLLSITESFGFSDFLHINDLHGLSKPFILGEKKEKVEDILPVPNSRRKGFIILEDFVGTGDQASGVLAEVRRHTPSEWRIIFVPLIILEQGLTTLANGHELADITIEPVLIIPNTACVREMPATEEPPEFKHIRALVKLTAKNVLERLGSHDDPPKDPFGYKGSGALVVTCHNTPNNTLPLIHHRAPDWNPLFRRVHHSKDGLR